MDFSRIKNCIFIAAAVALILATTSSLNGKNSHVNSAQHSWVKTRSFRAKPPPPSPMNMHANYWPGMQTAA